MATAPDRGEPAAKGRGIVPDSLGGERPPPLEAYRKKRDPDRTPEPFGGRPPSGGRLFVVQKHAARRLHYDLRLEMDGVLKSWAVPKGPSGHAEEKRLAVHVEDHPIEYGDFEGVIPAGNYGAGSVIVWDYGWYRSSKPQELLDQLARGKLEVEIFGHKMRGRWTLARMSGKDRDWLLLKKADGAALPPGGVELIERYPQSVLSGLTVEEMADRPARLAAVRARLDALGAPRGEVDARAQAFTLATLAERPFSDPAWLYEIKYDGVRVLADRRGERVTLYGRSGQDITARYPEVARALRALPIERFVIDGEIVALDDAGRPSFQRLQPRMALTDPREIATAAERRPAVGVFFDCLMLDDRDLRRRPLLERKECLRLLVPPLGPVRYGDHVIGEGVAFFEAASEQRLEGIVAKKARGTYPGGRTRDWIKIKCQKRQEFVIGGYTDPQGSRGHFGALHLGLYDGPRRRRGSSTSRRSAPDSTGPASPRSGSGCAPSRARRRPSRRAPSRPGAGTTGWSREPSARCASPTGPRTAGSVTRRSSACARTGSRRSAGGRRRSRSISPRRTSPRRCLRRWRPHGSRRRA